MASSSRCVAWERSEDLGRYWRSKPLDSVLVAPALPWTLGIAEVDLHTRLDGEADVLGHFLSLIPGDGASQLGREGQDALGHGLAHRLGTVAIGELEQHDVAAVALDEGPDRGHLLAEDVGSDRSALPAFELVGFSGPPAEPDVRLSPHPALHRFMPLVRVILSSWRSSMVWGCGRAGSGIE